ncbi:MAG TPA: N-6 DNA methylase [Solirubrobacterales bacterium]|nr:N-6 DNA methylase [Solirubrobacterales bacterium]
MSAWRQVHEAALRLAAGREAVRLANLAIAASAAAEDPLDGRRLRPAVRRLAVAGSLECEGGAAGWRGLAAAARAAAPSLVGADGHDDWVQAFQEADAARKSRGAYATPRALAEPMARLLLRRNGSVPARILDPSAGGGGLLLAVFRRLVGAGAEDRDLAAAAARLHGVELDPVARELCCLQIWLACRGSEDIASIASRIHRDNAITRDWSLDEPYDALIMNPPWESLRHPGIADQEDRRATVERLRRPVLDQGSGLPPLFSCHGRGDRNLYKAFLELAPHLVRRGAPIVALVPGAWSSDLGTQELRELYLSHTAVEQWTSFENRRGYFPIDGRYKFGVLRARRDPAGTRSLRVLGMADEARRLSARHVRIPAGALDSIGGRSLLIPDLVSDHEARLLHRIATAGSGIFDGDSALGRVAYERELDLTEDRKRGKFVPSTAARRVAPDRWVDAEGRSLHPLVEGRMVGQYDFLEKSWVGGAGRTARWTYNNGHALADCRPQFLAPAAASHRDRLAICDITSATNRRTVHAAWLPPAWRCGNTAPVLVFDDDVRALAALAVLNSMVFDWQARRTVSGLHLNRFYLEAMHWPRLDPEAVSLLAARALALLSLGRRFREIAPGLAIPPTEIDYVDAHAEIEGLVAAGFGMTEADLLTVFDPSESNRRGFWRVYRSDPNAKAIVERVLETGARVAAGG